MTSTPFFINIMKDCNRGYVMSADDMRKNMNILNESISASFMEEPAGNPRITITYEIVTPESAEHGDAEERGWIDEEGVDMTPDQYDLEDGETAASKAVEFLQNEGASEPSSSAFHDGVWYSTPDGNQDYRTGATEYRSFHLNDFTPEDEEAIYAAMTSRR